MMFYMFVTCSWGYNCDGKSEDYDIRTEHEDDYTESTHTSTQDSDLTSDDDEDNITIHIGQVVEP